MLYPYRRSAMKNRQRWSFGVLYPPAWIAANPGADRSDFQLECLVMGDASSRISLTVRFLHLASIANAGRSSQEAMEREVAVENLEIGEIALAPHTASFTFQAENHETVRGQIAISAAAAGEGAFRLTVRVRNMTILEALDREQALPGAMVSAHA